LKFNAGESESIGTVVFNFRLKGWIIYDLWFMIYDVWLMNYDWLTHS
jgi:hypothetical protein